MYFGQMIYYINGGIFYGDVLNAWGPLGMSDIVPMLVRQPLCVRGIFLVCKLGHTYVVLIMQQFVHAQFVAAFWTQTSKCIELV